MCQNFKSNLVVILKDSLDSVTSVIKILDPNWSGLTQFQQDAAAAITAVENWQSGTPAQDVVQILDILIADINLFPVSDVYKAVIVIALDGIKSVIVLIEEHSTGTTQAAAQAVMARTQQATVTMCTAPAGHAEAASLAEAASPVAAASPAEAADRKVDPWVPPTMVYEGARQYALAWNKEVSNYPNLGTAKVQVPRKWGVLP